MRKTLLVPLMAVVCNAASAQAPAKVDSIISSMTVRQKVAQLVVPAIESCKDDSLRRERQINLVKAGVGGVIVMDGELRDYMEMLNELQSYSQIPLMVAIDGEWGVSMRFPQFPYYPRQMQLGALRSTEMIYQMGRFIGREMNATHIGVNYAPDVDVNCNSQNPVINMRSFGEDPDKVARYAAAYAAGMEDEGVSACAKHFPGHGDTSVDSHRALPVLNFDMDRMRRVELAPFKHLSEYGVDMVMLAHLSVPALDPSGMPTSVSKPTIDFLRREIGFGGLVVTDALGMAGVMQYFDNNAAETCLAAYKAGVDVLLMPKGALDCIDYISSKIESGELPVSDLDRKVRRVLNQKLKQGLLEADYVNKVDVDEVMAYAARSEERDFIARLSAESIICVKDTPGNVLKGRTAYLALGAGEEKRVPTMDEDTNKPRQGEGDGPAAYGARRGVGESGAEAMASKLGVDSFFLPRDFTFEDLVAMREKLAGYKTVVLGFHDTDTRPQYNYGIKDKSVYDYIGEWAARQNLVGVYCGSPYALDVMPWYRRFKAFYIAWADNRYNCEASAEIILGKRTANGVMPVSAGGLKAGSSGNRR